MIESKTEPRLAPLTVWLAAALALLILASTLNGLTFDVRVLGRSVTLRPDQLSLLPLLVVLAVGLAKGGVRWTWSWTDVPVLGLLLVNAVSSILFSPVRGVSLQGVFLMGVYVVMYAASRLASQACGRWLWVIRAFAVVAMGQCLYGLAAFLAGAAGADIGGLQTGQVMRGSVTVRGTFWEANLLGIFLALLGVCLIVAAMVGRATRVRLASSLALVPVGLTLALTMTRSAWLTFAVVGGALMLFGCREGRSRRAQLGRLVPPVLSLVVVVALSIWVIDPTLARMWGQDSVLVPRLSGIIESIRTGVDKHVGPGSTPAVPRSKATPTPTPGGAPEATGTPVAHAAPHGAMAKVRYVSPSNGPTSVWAPGGSAPQAASTASGAEAAATPTAAPADPTSGTPTPTPTSGVDSVSGGSNNSVVGRLSLYWEALSLGLERPVLGHGTFAGEVIERHYWVSSLGQAMYDTGLVGVVLLLWLYASVVVAGWRAYRMAPPGWMRSSLLAACACNVVLIVTSQFSSFLWVGFPWVFMGLTMGLVGTAQSVRPETDAAPKA